MLQGSYWMLSKVAPYWRRLTIYVAVNSHIMLCKQWKNISVWKRRLNVHQWYSTVCTTPFDFIKILGTVGCAQWLEALHCLVGHKFLKNQILYTCRIHPLQFLLRWKSWPQTTHCYYTVTSVNVPYTLYYRVPGWCRVTWITLTMFHSTYLLLLQMVAVSLF